METITSAEFRRAPGVENWTVSVTGASAHFRTGDFATGARLFAAIAELSEAANHHPDVDVRYSGVWVRLFTHSAGGLTMKDAAHAQRISAAARELGIEAGDTPMEPLMLAVATPAAGEILPFWRAVTGYEQLSGSELNDPRGHGPLIWFQEIDKPLRGARMHIDVCVPRDRVDDRIAAAIEAGGRMVDDSNAPEWWTLADADGHKVDIQPQG